MSKINNKKGSNRKVVKAKPVHYKRATKLGCQRDKVKDKDFITEITDFKRDNDLLAYYYMDNHIDDEHPKTLERILSCRTHIKAVMGGNDGHIVETYSCGNRFCPACAKSLSVKNNLKISTILSYLSDSSVIKKLDGYDRKFDKCNFIFITLTVPNCKGEDLASTIDAVNAGFKRFSELKMFKKISLGYIKKLEVTLNCVSEEGSKIYPYSPVSNVHCNDDYDYYNEFTGVINKYSDAVAKKMKAGDHKIVGYNFHPHLHVLVAVKKSYGSNGHYYLTQDDIAEMWSKSMRQSNLVVDVRAVDDNAVAEISKYCAKKEDYLLTSQVFKFFYDGLYRKKFLSFSGIMKSAAKLFKQGLLDEYLERERIPIDSYIDIFHHALFKIVDGYYPEDNNFVPFKTCELNNARRTICDDVLKYNRYVNASDGLFPSEGKVSLHELRNTEPDLYLKLEQLMAVHYMRLEFDESENAFYYTRMSKHEHDEYMEKLKDDGVYFDAREQFLKTSESLPDWLIVDVSETPFLENDIDSEDADPNIAIGNLHIVAENKNTCEQLSFNIPTFNVQV